MGKKDHNCIKIEKGIKNNAGYEINLLFLTPPPFLDVPMIINCFTISSDVTSKLTWIHECVHLGNIHGIKMEMNT